MVVALSAVISAMLAAAFKTLVMGSFMRIRQLIMKLSMTPAAAVFIIVRQGRNDRNAEH